MRFRHLVIGLWLFGCGSSNPAPSAPNQSAKPASGEETSYAPPTTNECAQGKPRQEVKDCKLLVKGFCFEDDVAACACAGCERSRCTFDYSDPIQPACEK